MKLGDDIYPLAHGIEHVLGMLKVGLTGDAPTSVHASRRGLSLKINGQTIARGKTLRELGQNYDASMKKLLSK